MSYDFDPDERADESIGRDPFADDDLAYGSSRGHPRVPGQPFYVPPESAELGSNRGIRGDESLARSSNPPSPRASSVEVDAQFAHRGSAKDVSQTWTLRQGHVAPISNTDSEKLHKKKKKKGKGKAKSKRTAGPNSHAFDVDDDEFENVHVHVDVGDANDDGDHVPITLSDDEEHEARHHKHMSRQRKSKKGKGKKRESVPDWEVDEAGPNSSDSNSSDSSDSSSSSDSNSSDHESPVITKLAKDFSERTHLAPLSNKPAKSRPRRKDRQAHAAAKQQARVPHGAPPSDFDHFERAFSQPSLDLHEQQQRQQHPRQQQQQQQRQQQQQQQPPHVRHGPSSRDILQMLDSTPQPQPAYGYAPPPHPQSYPVYAPPPPQPVYVHPQPPQPVYYVAHHGHAPPPHLMHTASTPALYGHPPPHGHSQYPPQHQWTPPPHPQHPYPPQQQQPDNSNGNPFA